MDRSLFLARLIGPTFVAIALGMLINLGVYERMIAEALHTGIVFYLSGLLSLLAGLAIVNLHNMVRGLARHLHYSWLAYDDRRDHPHRHAAGCCCDRVDHLWRSRIYDCGRANHRRAWRFS
jgi:hypothetical protein